MKKLGVIVNKKRPNAASVLAELKALAEQYGFQLFAETAENATLLGATHLPVELFGETVDVALALGGDGTVLYTARALHGSGVPIMGINLGSLGFLTGVSDTEVKRGIKMLVEKDYNYSERMIADCCIQQDGQTIGEEHALNDIVLGWGASSRIVTLGLTVDGDFVGTFMCDGMIVATPTGSTGHSLAAGGPIIHPNFNGMVINVICPHTLSSRPLIVPENSQIEIEVLHTSKDLILSIDGQDEYAIRTRARLTVSKSPSRVTFLQFKDHSYFSVLSKKLHWRGSSL